MGIEYELKFAATAAQQDTLAKTMTAEERRIAMQTTYYDTAQLELSARRWTLRRRLENGRSICTLKTPAGALGRGEWDCEADTIQQAIPRLVRESGCEALAELAGHGLVSVCGARFTRRAWVLHRGDTRVELALDRGILFGGGREQPLCEIEFELLQGSREAAAACAAEFAERFTLVPEPASKFRRALDLARGENT